MRSLLHHAMEPFKRPDNVKFPTIWHEFRSKSGKNYTIQDIPDEYKNVIKNHVKYNFMREEPLFRFSLATAYPKFLNSESFWKEQIANNLSLVCLTKDEFGEDQIAGFNCMYVARKKPDDWKFEIEKSSISKIIETHMYVFQKADAFDALGIEEYLNGIGLYVLPEFRGESIGLELLKAREPFCKALGVKTSCTTFTSIFSQKIAEKAGFKELYSITYEELAKVNSELRFPGIENHSKSIKFMFKRYD